MAMGADYVGSGAVYETATKSSSCIGLRGLSAVCEAIKPVPVVGIGGVEHSNGVNASRARPILSVSCTHLRLYRGVAHN